MAGTRSFSNTILSRLSPKCIDAFGRNLQFIDLELKHSIYVPNKPIQQACFPESGMLSVVSTMSDGRSIEVGTIGSEGVAGATFVDRAVTLPYHCYVQMAGRGHVIDVAILQDVAEKDETLYALLSRYQLAFLIQSMQGIVCNGLHSIAQRCCRWLLTSHDRAESSVVPITHEFLALMLGVRRASVTDVLGPIQDRRLIQSSRGEITILDRKGLEAGSCECYGLIVEQQRQLLA